MKNWQTKKLGEVCDILDTKRKPVTKRDRISGIYPYYGASGEVDRVNKYLFDEDLLLVSEDGANLLARTYPIAFSIKGKTWVNNHAHVLKFDDIENQKFIEYYLNSIRLDPYISGMAQPKLNQKMLNSIKVPFPEFFEQKIIVKKLDTIFENIDKAKENTDKNLQNSKELFDAYLENIFNSNKYEVKKLSEISEYFNGLTYSPKDVDDNGIIVLRSSNVQNDRLDFSDIVRVKHIIKDKLYIQDGDILMCSRNGSKRLVGKTATITGLTEPMTFGTFMMIVRGQYNDYLSWFFKSTYFRKQIAGGENTMIGQITRYMLDDIKVSFPPEEERATIIKKLDELSEQAKKLEENYKKKVLLLDELKKSVLAKAFAGEL